VGHNWQLSAAGTFGFRLQFSRFFENNIALLPALHGRHCCIKAKGVLAVPQSGVAGPSDTLENHNKPGI
jgi:hypothetical protein